MLTGRTTATTEYQSISWDFTELPTDKNKKTLFISLSNGFAVRYILRSGIFKRLVDREDLHLVIHSPYSRQDYFIKEFSRPNVTLEYFDVERAKEYMRKRPGLGFLVNVRAFGIRTSHIIDVRRRALIKKYWGRKSLRFRVYAILFALCSLLLQKSRFLRDFVVAFEEKRYPGLSMEAVFSKHKPDAILVCSPGFYLPDALVMRQARRCGLGIIAVVLSWDNSSSKGLPGGHFDHCIVWTRTMAEEMHEFYGVSHHDISISGIAHFDNYFHDSYIMSREEICDRLALDPDKRIVFFGMGVPKRYAKENLEIPHRLADAAEKGEFGDNVTILVRPHPNCFHRAGWTKHEILSNLKKEYALHNSIRIFMPLFKMENETSMDLDTEDQRLLASTVKHSDVVVCFFSTLNIEACIFDTPVVNVSFHRYLAPLDAMMSEARRYKHNKRIADSGGVSVADNEDQVTMFVKRYLDKPELDSEGRSRVVANECEPNPGRASEVFVQQLLGILESVRQNIRAGEAA